MPMLLRWQTELLTINATETPAMQQLVSNSTQIAASVERVSRVAEQLPGQVSTEREEILKALQAQEKDVTSLMTSGTQMSDSLNTTLTTLDALMKRFGVGETNNAGPPKTNAEPFRIQDYTQTAAQLEATARQLTELLVTLDQTLGSTNLAKLSAQVGPVVQQAQTGGREIVDYAFWKGILLVVVALLAALIYRFLVARMSATNSNSKSP
jgi:ABC-type transporter Mla subunit MlaD